VSIPNQAYPPAIELGGSNANMVRYPVLTPPPQRAFNSATFSITTVLVSPTKGSAANECPSVAGIPSLLE
jgi:hypothetical protein